MEETPLTTVPVRVQKIDDPVRTKELPSVGGATVTRNVPVTAIRILPDDPRRSSAKLVSFDQDMLIAFNVSSKETPATMSRWPKTVPFITDVSSAIWVAAYTGTTDVSATSAYWASGEN